MKSFRIFSAILLLAGLIFPSITSAATDSNATVVKLRTICTEAGKTLHNCFTTTAALKTWIYGRANPSAKLLIEVGPGTFGSFSCSIGDAAGNVGGDLTFRGSGAGKTSLDGPSTSTGISGVAHNNCVGTKWVFENITVKGTYAVVWFGGGESTWNNVMIDGSNAAWYDAVGGSGDVCPAGQQGTHRIFSSRLTSPGVGGFAFLNACGDNWFWGSEIALVSAGGNAVFVSAGAGNRIHLYGSNVRAEAAANAGASGSLTAISASNGAEVHSHGVGIDVVGKPGWTVTAINASSGAEVHANESSYFMKGATIRRIVNDNAHVHAPYLWEHIPSSPLESVTGADMATETVGTDINMLIYNSVCNGNGGPWYNVALRTCR
jgi:hypothetical protein